MQWINLKSAIINAQKITRVESGGGRKVIHLSGDGQISVSDEEWKNIIAQQIEAPKDF